MPHLTELQAKHADDGVTVIAVTKEDSRNTLDAVKALVEDKNDIIGFTVAWDDAGQTYNSYMTATGSKFIPQSFVIDKQGRLAFYGHPMELDEPLKKIIAGQWDPAKDFAALIKKREAQAAVSKEIDEINRATQNSLKGKGAGEVLERWRALEKTHPDLAADLGNVKYRVLTSVGEYDAAAALGRKLVDEAVEAKDHVALNMFSWDIVDPERKLEKRDLMLAMYGATVACNLTNYENAPILDTLARVHFLAGGLDRAIELQELAVEHAHESMKDGLQKVLDEYKSSRSL